MEKMNNRQRFRETILFGNPDKVPLNPGGPRESTLRAWYEQGLPRDVNWMDYLLHMIGVEPESHKHQYVDLGVSFRMIPTFEEKILEHKNGHYIVQDWMGAITEISDEFDYTYIRTAKDFVTRKWHKFPIQNRDDWDAMKERYKVDTVGRFPDDFEERCQVVSSPDYDHVVTFRFNGPFWQLREWLGFENLCIMMIEDPEFIEEMIDFWTDFASQTMSRILQQAAVDCVGICEDMAYKAHSMISPAMTRRFLQPSYNRWVKEIKSKDCPIIDMDSDGYIGELIPIWIESGINCCDPIEVAAGNDILEYRRRFGRQMAYRGGIDKRALAKGGQVMRDEIMRIVPPLIEGGGYIPGCDHGVPPDISWNNFVEYTKLLAELTGWL
jgi:hypothetical protein